MEHGVSSLVIRTAHSSREIHYVATLDFEPISLHDLGSLPPLHLFPSRVFIVGLDALDTFHDGCSSTSESTPLVDGGSYVGEHKTSNYSPEESLKFEPKPIGWVERFFRLHTSDTNVDDTPSVGNIDELSCGRGSQDKTTTTNGGCAYVSMQVPLRP